jgi:hypothetical protein
LKQDQNSILRLRPGTRTAPGSAPPSATLAVVEQLEAWLAEQGITVVWQVLTGSGDMLRYRLRLPDGAEIEVAFPGATLAERPYEVIDLMRRRIESHEAPQQHQRGNGH